MGHGSYKTTQKYGGFGRLIRGQAMFRPQQILTAILVVAFVGGCASTPPTVPTWTSNRSASQDEWLKDRYACHNETKQRISGASVDQSGGIANSLVVPMCTAFNACLAARGYTRNDAAGYLGIPKGAELSCASVNQ